MTYKVFLFLCISLTTSFLYASEVDNQVTLDQSFAVLDSENQDNYDIIPMDIVDDMVGGIIIEPLYYNGPEVALAA